MKKVLKIMKKIIVLVVLVYALFIVEEAFRLLFFKKLWEPLIVFEEKYTDSNITYKSLGFAFKRNLKCKSDDLCFVVGNEFWLFDKIPISIMYR